MPTYKNNTDNAINVDISLPGGGKFIHRVEPDATFQTEHIVSLVITGLTKISEHPYYNPSTATPQVVTSTGVGDDKTITLDLNTRVLNICNNNNIYLNVFFRNTENTPATIVFPNSIKEGIELNYNVDRIIVQFSGAGTIYIEEIK